MWIKKLELDPVQQSGIEAFEAAASIRHDGCGAAPSPAMPPRTS